MAKAPLTPLVLHGVVAADHHPSLPTADAQLVTFRDVAAVARPVPNGVPPGRESLGSPAELTTHRTVVEALHRQGPVLPAPVAVLARDSGAVLKWLEVHYVALSEALTFIEGRSAARVHVTRTPVAASSSGPLDVPPLDLDGVSTELFRILRRHAAASTAIRQAATEAERATAAFLVESDRWDGFVEAVVGEGRRNAGIHVELTGPWPPYDFVKMQFGG